MIVEFRFRSGSAAEWLTGNPVLSQGEPGYEIDSGRLKLGDGSTPWADLPYATADPVLLTQVLASIVQPRTYTSAQLADVTHAVNTLDKHTSKPVFDTTLGRPLWALDDAAADPWVDATGATVHTPA